MSHSPTAAVNDPEKDYLDGWQDLAVRIQQGQSFSGRERNCCFLNTGGKRFADISAAVGLDQIDDCRAIAMVDWDHDGDLDMFQANRTGPRVRFLENRFNASPRSISLRLVGDPTQRCNRDAIGARARISIKLPNGETSVLTRTLYAGDAFVSQSSKWLHFGLPLEAEIVATGIRWPGSADWTPINGIDSTGRFLVRQSTNHPERQSSRERVTFKSGPPVPADEDATMRVALPRPQNVLPLEYHALQSDAATQRIAILGKTRLLVMWAPWCEPCLAELSDLKSHAPELSSAGIEIVALSVDSISEGMESARQAATDYQNDAKLPFAVGLADESSLQRITKVWQDAMYRDRQFPIPSSFLIDPQGRLRVVYNGRVSADQLVEDVAKLTVPEEQLRYAAVPFEGRWADPLFVTNPIAIASIYREELQYDDADEYLARYQRENSPPPTTNTSEDAARARRRYADVCYHRGKIAMDRRQLKEALELFNQALHYDPRMVPAMIDISSCQQRTGNLVPAIRSLQNALKLQPRNPGGWNQLGVMYLSAHENENASKCFERALKLNSREFSAANNLAWLRATAKESHLRNGEQAVQLATMLAEGPGVKRADVHDTLAAACAEAGDFDAAEKHGLQALELANQQGQAALAKRIQQRLELYRRSKAYRSN